MTDSDQDPVPLKFYYFLLQTINSTLIASVPFVLLVLMIRNNHSKVGINYSKIKYFNLILLVYMVLNSAFTIIMKTCDCTHVPFFKSYKVIVFLILDFLRVCCNCLILYLGHKMPDSEISQMFYQNLTDSTSISDKHTSMSSGLDDFEEQEYFACRIEKKQTYHADGFFFHEFSVIFKPRVYRRKQSQYMTQSITDKRFLDQLNTSLSRGPPLDNALARSLSLSFEGFSLTRRDQNFSEYMHEVTKQLNKRPEDIRAFAAGLSGLDNSIVNEYEFFSDIGSEDLDLDQLEKFLNRFMNQTYKVSSQIQNSCSTLNAVKSFLQLDYDAQIPNLVDGFSLRIDFPGAFCPEKKFFEKLFSHYLVLKLKLDESKTHLRLEILNRARNQTFQVRRRVEDFVDFVQRLYPSIESVNQVCLSSEKKCKQMVYLLNVALNELRNQALVSEFVGSQFAGVSELPFTLPQFEVTLLLRSMDKVERRTTTESIEGPNAKAEPAQNKKIRNFEISVVSDTSLKVMKIERNVEHFQVLSNHLAAKFRTDEFNVKKRDLEETSKLQAYLSRLVRSKQCWESIEFQLFLKIAKVDFNNF